MNNVVFVSFAFICGGLEERERSKQGFIVVSFVELMIKT
jgi:hypothetical protein